MKKLFSHPMFSIGLLVRLILIGLLLPQAPMNWYVPFLEVTTQRFTVDPWDVWLSQSGSLPAFPYGYVMWLAFLPLTMLCKLVNLPVHYGYGITLIAADITLLAVLHKFLARERFVLATYWLSPIVVLATYWLGLNDLIPV